MNCEICGKQEVLYKAIVEGSELLVCSGCGRFGKIISQAQIEQKPFPKKHELPKKNKESIDIIVQNYGELIKKAREKIGLSQEDFAKKINEKISVVHKLETSTFEPSIEFARKLEKFLKVKLVLEYEETGKVNNAKGNDTVKIGDVVKIKK